MLLYSIVTNRPYLNFFFGIGRKKKKSESGGGEVVLNGGTIENLIKKTVTSM